MSATMLVSPGTRFVAAEWNPTWAAPAAIVGQMLWPLPCEPPGPRLTGVVVPAWRSRRKMSSAPFVSPARGR